MAVTKPMAIPGAQRHCSCDCDVFDLSPPSSQDSTPVGSQSSEYGCETLCLCVSIAQKTDASKACAFRQVEPISSSASYLYTSDFCPAACSDSAGSLPESQVNMERARDRTHVYFLAYSETLCQTLSEKNVRNRGKLDREAALLTELMALWRLKGVI